MQKLSNQPTRQLFKSPSVPAYQDTKKCGTNTTIYTSSSSIESVQDQWRQCAIKWLMQFDRKITKDTNYLSVWYLEMLQRKNLILKQSNWQLVAAAIILFASKMNEIYPPCISSIIKRCKSTGYEITKDSLIDMESRILNIMQFDVAIQSPFNLICQLVKDSKKDIDECQKLLKIIVYNKDINQYESEILAYAIIYLIARSKIDAHIQGEIRTKVKIVAQKIYNFYKQAKKNHDDKKSKVQEHKVSAKLIDVTHSKQNNTQNVDLYGSMGGYNKSDQSNIKKAQQNYLTLTRVNSYKFIPKQKPFTEATNNGDNDRKLINCLSKDDLRGSYKNFYLYS